jgi:DeoR/GlpR family transcriptional regulator of sugar metabolism
MKGRWAILTAANIEEIRRLWRNGQIVRVFNGQKVEELAGQFHCSEMTIRRAIAMDEVELANRRLRDAKQAEARAREAGIRERRLHRAEKRKRAEVQLEMQFK